VTYVCLGMFSGCNCVGVMIAPRIKAIGH
jgi:hypothetical protein